MAPSPDLVVVGGGIVGLAHAADAHRRGLRVTVLERDAHAVGASVRNFGHVCTTAQDGEALELALVAREQWLRLSAQAGFEVSRAGTLVVARTAAELGVLEELAAERGTEQVTLLDAASVRARLPDAPGVVGGAHLPLDLRLDPRAALPALAAWLESSGVEIRFGTSVGAVGAGRVLTSYGEVAAPAVVVAVGHDLDRLLPGVADEWEVRRCRLQMLEVAPPGDVTIEPAVLSGTSMLRYGALARQPAAADVRREIEARTPELLEVVMNLMLTQRPDGSIVLGDTHHYARTHTPFDDERLADLLLREGARLLGSPLRVRRRWRGVYADSPRTDFLVAAPYAGVRAVAVTSGIGMTTALGLAPRVLDGLLG